MNTWLGWGRRAEDGLHIHIGGGVACDGWHTLAAGKPETDDPIAGAPTFEMMVLKKRGDRWLLVLRSVWRVSQ
jgi:hypothetical protein